MVQSWLKAVSKENSVLCICSLNVIWDIDLFYIFQGHTA